MKWTRRLTNFFATSLQRKLLLVVTVVVTLVMIAFGFYWVDSQRQTASTELEDRATRTADLLAQTTALPLWNIDTAGIEAQFKAVMADPEVSSVSIYETGKSQPTVTRVQETAAVDPITRKAEIILLRGEEPTSLGIVQIVFTRESLYRSLNQTQVLIGFIVLALILLLIISIYFVVGRLVTNPLHEMAALTSRVSAGDYTGRANLTSRDEMSMLASAFNSMTTQLRSLISSLEERVAERTAQLRTAAEVGRVAASILEPMELLNQVVNLIAESFGFYYVAVFTLERSKTYLVLREATGEAGRVLKERGHRLRVGLDSMVGYAALKREPRVAQQAELDATRFANPLLPDTQSEIALPLLVGDQVLGALDVQSSQLNAFDESIIATLQNVAAQIAVALQNAQSYQRLQEALGYTTRQYELSRTIFTARTPSEAYQSLGQVFAMVSDIDRINVLQVSERDAAGLPTEYELVTEWDVLGGAQFDKGLRYAAAETPLARLVTEDEVIVIRDAQDTRLPLDTRQQLSQAGVQAAMLVPLTIRGQLEGFIAAVAEQPHDFEDSEVRLMQSAAEQLGVVLSNLQLTTDMQTTLDRVALLNRRLSGESWNSYLTSRDQWLVESGQAQQAMTTTRLQVPIVIRGETIGMFNVADARADRQWQEEELTMLQTIAGEVALAIENARLIEQTQRAAQREKDVASAADKIHRSINLDAILQTAVEEVMRIAGTTEVAIQLGQPVGQSDNEQHPAMA